MRGPRAGRAWAVTVAAAMVATAGTVAVVPSSAGAATATFPAAEDTFVSEARPSKSYGAATRLVVDGSPARRTFARFDVVELTAPVTGARLRLHVTATNAARSGDAGTVRSMSDTTWSERTVTWASQPAVDGAILGSLGAVPSDTWVEVDVSAAVTGNGAFSFALTTASGDAAVFDSGESGTTAPELVVTTGAGGDPTTTTTTTAPGTDPVLVGAGDIAGCASSGDDVTARLLDGIAGMVFTVGDNAYPSGTAAEFVECYGPSWGRHRARTRPAAGNHEYETAGAAGYFGYFGPAAGDPAKGYYSYDLGSWHVVVVNSNCVEVGGCGIDTPQERWLRADLAASARRCTVAYWHHALFTSGADHAPSTRMRPLFKALYDHGAEVVVSGHNHNYERFAPQSPGGSLDTSRGVRQFVVGTGGFSHDGFGTVQPNSQVRDAMTYGVLELTLRADRYDWRFVAEPGATFTDSGSTACH